MYCPKCGKRIANDAFFCQWCGSELLVLDTDAIVERINMLTALDKSYQLAMAKYIAAIWRSGDYKTHYDSLESFGKARLGMEKSSLYKYKSVGMRFVNEYGEPLIPDAEKWGYAKLTVLIAVSFDEISFLREKNLIAPEMTSSELRSIISKWQENKTKCST